MRLLDGAVLLNELGIDHLKNAAVLGAMSDDAIAYLLKNGRIHAFHKGETVVKAGDPSVSFFIVLKGSIAYYQASNDHSEHIFDFHFGEAVGFVSMIALTPWPGTAIAANNSYVLEVTTDLFYALHCEKPLDFGVLLINLSRELARRILTLAKTVAELKKADQ
ncbi:Crp/Fnr family transcriptional regulator [Microbulbifer marinus]|uniref:Cyclic nucleotide-binding domain-containing protein n=1 Tax=Microbulbifer marinus TaxID=658218 RepID=A0A1H3W2C8_9GAMM|nr:cyclic nucleotide-binding domain-containing protein [Microbulbifer marinus]SDZ81041.1 Cyclic nucleotide-binding domain-containing protein [Microbulbifer marinus]